MVSTAASPAIRLIMAIRYMWSAMLSGPATLHLTQPVRLVSCRQWQPTPAASAVAQMQAHAMRAFLLGRSPSGW